MAGWIGELGWAGLGAILPFSHFETFLFSYIFLPSHACPFLFRSYIPTLLPTYIHKYTRRFIMQEEKKWARPGNGVCFPMFLSF